MAKPYNKIYLNQENISMDIFPQDVDNHEEYNITVIQETGKCLVNINVHPEKDSLSKVNIRIFAENDANVDCVCSCYIAKDASGVDTDMQIRSWPFDKSRIQARPEMFVLNNDIKAAHGNALGTLSQEDRYYLNSKGITNYKDILKESLYAE